MRIDRRLAYALAPVVSSKVVADLFGDDPSAYAIVVLGKGDDRWQQPEMADAWHRLRCAIYGEHGYLHEGMRVTAGGEFDDEEDCAVHLLALKRTEPDAGLAIGGMRCLIKEEQRTLPVERYFPDAFKDAPAPARAIETSRLIVVETDSSSQREIMVNLFAIAYAEMLRRVGPFRYTYGVIGEDLERTLPRFAGLPVRRISDEVPVPYGTSDIAIKADMAAFVENYGRHRFSMLKPETGWVFRWGSPGVMAG